MVEFTLSIYLFGFAIGTFFWGLLSDFFGRKPCLLAGLFIYLLGCIGCLYSDSIYLLLASRFIQSFGGSTGSVLGQAICRDSFEGKRLGEVYASVGSALALSPAIGPILGGITDQIFGWNAIFILLAFLGTFTFIAALWKLPETRTPSQMPFSKLLEVFKKMLLDRPLLYCGLIVAACNGILFSYYAEGSFYLIQLLNLSPSMYGLSFVGLSLSGVAAGIMTRRLYSHKNKEEILALGTSIILCGALSFTIFSLLFYAFGNLFAIVSTVCCMMIIQFGSGMTLAVVLAKSLENYRYAIGFASSFFGLFYYMIISLLTFIIGMAHSENLLAMPIYFACIAVCIKWLSSKVMAPQPVQGGML